MCDTKIRLGIHDHGLWRHTTRPEYRHLSFFDRYHIAKVGMVDIPDADCLRIADVHRCSMYLGHCTGNQHSLRNQFLRNGSHAHYHISMENSGTLAGNIGLVHRNIAVFFNLADRNIGT